MLPILIHTKNQIILNYVSEVEYMEFYRDMFPVDSFEERGHQEQQKANGIFCSIDENKRSSFFIF